MQFYMDQHKAETVIQILALSFLFTPFNQLPNILVKLAGGEILKVKYIIRQIMQANGHEMNKWSTVLQWVTKKLSTSIPFCLATLSFVRITLLFKNHMNILNLSGIFIFHRYLRKILVWPFIKSKYIDFTVNIHVSVRFHLKMSRVLVSWTAISLRHSCNHWSIYI
jgi:hypothetical protein